MINFGILLEEAKKKKKCKVAVLGSNGSFGYTFLSQLLLMEDLLDIRVVCDLDIEKTKEVLKEQGYDEKRFYPCKSEEDIRKAGDDAIIIIDNASLAKKTDADVIVEATGNPEMSAVHAEEALLSGKHVVMVSKEADVIAGPYLFKLAKEKGLIYSIAIGDQPANLINWISYIKALGMEVICAGKSSEYDFVYDLDTGDFRYRSESANIPELKNYWHLGSNMRKTLEMRSKLLDAYPQFAVPDYNEMNVIANATGLSPSQKHFHYPIINVSELADVYALEEDGGLISHKNSLDTFNCLHRPDEVSFAGGVFVIVKSHNATITRILKEKGHVVSSNSKYLALYLPYHYMGMEAPMSVLEEYYLGISSYESCENRAVMVSRTTRDFKKGEVLSLHTHHRCIMDLDVTLEKTEDVAPDTAPYYLIAEKKLKRDIPKGTVITTDMVDLENSELYRMINS